MNGVIKKLVVLFFVSLLSACGGGGGGGGNTPVPPPANTAPVASITGVPPVLAGALVALDGSGSSDADRDTLRHAWTLAAKPAGSTAALADATTARPSFTADQPGEYTVELVVNDGKVNSAVASVKVNALPVAGLQIMLNQTEPLSDPVRFTLSGDTAGALVAWFVSDVQLGTEASFDWDTTTVSNGSYVLVARIQLSLGRVHEVTRTVVVKNSSVRLEPTVTATPSTIYVDVRVVSPGTIDFVSTTLDGAPYATLTAPNYCNTGGCNVANLYRFSVDTAAAGSGEHVMVVSARNSLGDSRDLRVPLTISNAPRLNVSEPQNQTFVYGTLKLSGSAATDKPGAVTVTARLGDAEIYRGTTPSFSVTHDLTSAAAGSRVLTVTATDAGGVATTLTRTVVVASSGALAYEPALALGANGAFLAAEGDLVLYRADDQSLRLRNMTLSSEVSLDLTQISSLSDMRQWRVIGGRVFAEGNNFYCGIRPGSACVYQWDASGARIQISGGRHMGTLVARDGHVGWCTSVDSDGSGRYEVYDIATAKLTQIPLPAGVPRCMSGYDMSVVGGVLNFVFPGQTGTAYEIYRWRADTNVSTQVTSAGVVSGEVSSDSARLAWRQRPTLSSIGGALVVQSFLGGGSAVATSDLDSFALRDGLLAWSEVDGSGRRLKLSTGSATTTLSTSSTSSLQSVGGGLVMFIEDGRLYAWNVARAERRLLVDAAPGRVLLTQGVMYFVMSGSDRLYRLTVN